MIGRRELAAGVAVMLAFILAAVVLANAWQGRSDRQQSTRDARQATSLALRLAGLNYRQDIKRWHEVRRGCGRSVDDRRNSLRLLTLSARANQAVADDDVNTTTVRHLRGLEAAAQRHAVTGLRKHIPPKFTCAEAFPKPAAPPGVAPLP